MLVTVAICTWNRAGLLDRTLNQFQALRVPTGVDWELLAVNNNCTDCTDAVLGKYAATLPLRVLHESRQGHSHSRNRALAATRGELLLWTDDDVLVDPDWLAAYVNAAREHPSAAFFGGPVIPWFEKPPPRWVRRNLDLLEGPFALRDLDRETRSFKDQETPFGANMAFRTAALTGIHFDHRLGRVGAGMLSGDETSVMDRLRKAGHSGVWVGSARVQHFIPAARMTGSYVWKFFHGLGRTRQLLCPYDRVGPMLGNVPRWVWRRYLVARAKSLLASPMRSRWWLRNLSDAAIHRGILDQSRLTSGGVSS